MVLHWVAHGFAYKIDNFRTKFIPRSIQAPFNSSAQLMYQLNKNIQRW
jgi:hypothetical protein